MKTVQKHIFLAFSDDDDGSSYNTKMSMLDDLTFPKLKKKDS